MNQYDDNFYGRERFQEQYGAETIGSYTAKTFLWMFLGLMITFGVAIWGYMSMTTIYLLVYVPYSQIILLVAELAVVLFLSARIHRISVPVARVLFFLYAALNGIVFSAYLLIFNLAVLWMVFCITSLFFGIMALIGWFGNINFASLRPLMMGGLVFLLAYWVLAIFIDLSAFQTLICGAGIFIFLLFTAYDTKKIQAYYAYYGTMPEMAAKASIFAALQLYLDFINLFVYLVQILGRRK